jgi:exopolysaccharide biosynthesis protein
MRKLVLYLLFLVLWLPLLPAQQASRGWTKQKIDAGLVLWTLDQSADRENPQFVQVLRVGKKRSVKLAFHPSELKTTTEFATENQALAAVNAGFFDMKNGGSVTYLKADGKVISQNANDNPMITCSAFVVTTDGKVVIEPVVSPNYYTQSDVYADVLFTGPLLLLDGKVLEQDTARTFVTYRHPRTAACTLDNGDVLLLTADGRAKEAGGYSLPELAELMQELKCQDAINFDGGGSTTLWLKGQVVNHPSDNKTFDARGERRVANVVIIK